MVSNLFLLKTLLRGGMSVGVDSGREVAGSMGCFQRCCPPPPGCLHSPSEGRAALSPAHPQGVPSSLPSFFGSKCPSARLSSYKAGIFPVCILLVLICIQDYRSISIDLAPVTLLDYFVEDSGLQLIQVDFLGV